MLRLSAILIAACMVLIAASLGAVLYLAAGVSGPVAAIAAVGLLTGMALYNTVSNRVRDRRLLGDQIADLSRGTADLARQLAEVSRRVGTLEGRDSALRRGMPDPLGEEIGELGGLVKQLAETVAAHDAALSGKGGASAQPLTLNETMIAQPSAEASEAATGAQFRALGREKVTSFVTDAIEANRIDLYLQPIVTLPQRKVRYYEALSRLRTPEGDIIPAADFVDEAEAHGLLPKIDNMLMFRCVQVVRRLQLKNREVGLFCNVSAGTLSNANYFQQFLDFMDANRALASSLIFEFTQAAYRSFGPIENESLAALAERGYRFSIDHVQDLRLEPQELAQRSFRFLKVPASLLLNRTSGTQSDIHAADLADLLARSGIDLIAERIEAENMVIDLLDYDVRFGQGFLFSPPRPVRAEALQAEAEPAPSSPQPMSASERENQLLTEAAQGR